MAKDIPREQWIPEWPFDSSDWADPADEFPSDDELAEADISKVPTEPPVFRSAMTAGLLEDAVEMGATKITLEFDPQARPQPQRPDLDREVSYQVKFFYDHGYWSGEQMQGGPPIDMAAVMAIAVPIATTPEEPSAKVTRDRLIGEGLLF